MSWNNWQHSASRMGTSKPLLPCGVSFDECHNEWGPSAQGLRRKSLTCPSLERSLQRFSFARIPMNRTCHISGNVVVADDHCLHLYLYMFHCVYANQWPRGLITHHSQMTGVRVTIALCCHFSARFGAPPESST